MKNFLTAALTTLVTAAPVAAAPAAGNTFQDHQNLWEALQKAGVQTIINSTECEKDLAGFYWIPDGKNPQLVVCQENSTPGGPEVGWTAFDLDTLRHEAQHAIQDCVDGRQDMELDLVLPTEWSMGVLGQEAVQWIAETYVKNGATPSVVLAEYEAFAVAENVPASVIAQEVGSTCKFQF